MHLCAHRNSLQSISTFISTELHRVTTALCMHTKRARRLSTPARVQRILLTLPSMSSAKAHRAQSKITISPSTRRCAQSITRRQLCCWLFHILPALTEGEAVGKDFGHSSSGQSSRSETKESKEYGIDKHGSNFAFECRNTFLILVAATCQNACNGPDIHDSNDCFVRQRCDCVASKTPHKQCYDGAHRSQWSWPSKCKND